MLPRNHPDRIRIVFDDHRLVANAGLLLPGHPRPASEAMRELVDHHLDLGGAPGRANTGDKLMTAWWPQPWPAATASTTPMCCAPGEYEPRAPRGRHGQGCPSTLGTFLRSFRWGHVRQLDRVRSRELAGLGRWAAGAGPGDASVHHRPRLRTSLFRDFLRTGQGGRPPPRLYAARRPLQIPHAEPSPPAPETC